MELSYPEIGIQSWCLRKCTRHEQLIDALRRIGATRLEICPVHIDPAAPQAVADVVRQYGEAGIRFSSFGVFGFGQDLAVARRVFDLARAAGFTTIMADLKPGGLATVETLTAEYGMKIAIHNHGRNHCYGHPWQLDELFAVASDRIGLCLDTGWMMESGEDPVAVARKYRSRLFGVHIKDFLFDAAGKPEDVIAGTGELKLANFLAALREIAFDGVMTVEYEGEEPDPVPALTQCVANIRALA